MLGLNHSYIAVQWLQDVILLRPNHANIVVVGGNVFLLCLNHPSFVVSYGCMTLLLSYRALLTVRGTTGYLVSITKASLLSRFYPASGSL